MANGSRLWKEVRSQAQPFLGVHGSDEMTHKGSEVKGGAFSIRGRKLWQVFELKQNLGNIVSKEERITASTR